MYFSKSVVAVMASLMSLGLAVDPLSFTSWPKEPLEAGKPVTLTWTGATPDHPVTIFLREGTSGNLKDVKAITDQGKDGTFTWTPDHDVKDGKTYAFQISQDDQTNYTALLKSAGKPSADDAEADHTTGAATTATNTQATEGSTQATQATQTTLTSASSRALISSSATPSGSPSSTPSSSVAATSTETSEPTGTEIVNHKEASSTDSVQTGMASTSQSSMQLVMGVVGLLAYLV